MHTISEVQKVPLIMSPSAGKYRLQLLKGTSPSGFYNYHVWNV